MNRRNLLLGLGSATAAGSLLGSGALSRLTADRGVQVNVAPDNNAMIAIQPAEEGGSPTANSNAFLETTDNGSQALLDLAGEGGSNANNFGQNYDSVAFYDDVFSIVNQSESNVDLTITDSFADESVDGEPSVTLYDSSAGEDVGPDGSISSIQDPAQALTLGTGVSQNIGIKVDVPNDDNIGADGRDTISGEITLEANAVGSVVDSRTDASTADRLSFDANGDSTAPLVSNQNADSGAVEHELQLDFDIPQDVAQSAEYMTVQFPDNVKTDSDSDGDGFGLTDADSLVIGESLNIDRAEDLDVEDLSRDGSSPPLERPSNGLTQEDGDASDNDTLVVEMGNQDDDEVRNRQDSGADSIKFETVKVELDSSMTSEDNTRSVDDDTTNNDSVILGLHRTAVSTSTADKQLTEAFASVQEDVQIS